MSYLSHPPTRHNMVVTFLGTTSGGGPTETRNCSSLVVDATGRGATWMFDCAEGTVRQYAQQPYRDARRVKINDLNKIFITHMHADHTMGIITLLRNALGIFRGDPHAHPVASRPVRQPKIEIYGPAGIRHLIRTIFALTHTRSAEQYCVHELLFPGENASAPADDVESLHSSEEAGTDIHCDQDGFWRRITLQSMHSDRSQIIVDAGPIEHRDPCIGYIIRESFIQDSNADHDAQISYTLVPRSIVILGDTSDPTALIPLIKENPPTSVSLLIHEATDAYIPRHVDPQQSTGKNRTEQSVVEKAVEKGHSTPAMAGLFAKQISAEMLALNHIGARFPAPPQYPRTGRDRFRRDCMAELEDQANRIWMPAGGGTTTAVSDFDIITIPPNHITMNAVFQAQGEVVEAGEIAAASSSTLPSMPTQPQDAYSRMEQAEHFGGHSRGHRHHVRGGQRGGGYSGDGGAKREHSGGQGRDRHSHWRDKKAKTQHNGGRSES